MENMEEVNYTKLLSETLNATIKDQKKANKRLYTILISTILVLVITVCAMTWLIIDYKEEINKYTEYREQSITKEELIDLLHKYHLDEG